MYAKVFDQIKYPKGVIRKKLKTQKSINVTGWNVSYYWLINLYSLSKVQVLILHIFYILFGWQCLFFYVQKCKY